MKVVARFKFTVAKVDVFLESRFVFRVVVRQVSVTVVSYD